MKKLWIALCGCLFLGAQTGYAQAVADTGSAPTEQPAAATSALKVWREYRGVKLGLNSEEVHKLLGKPDSKATGQESFKLEGDDLLTAHYDNGMVKAIQLYFANAKNAPDWKEVIGDTEVTELANGAKSARVVLSEENFWVSMYRNKDGSITTVTISR